MGLELTVTKELASIGMTATELAAIARVIEREIGNRDFRRPFAGLLEALTACYGVVLDSLAPLVALDTEAVFLSAFDDTQAAYTGRYLQQASLPRPQAEEAFEQYLMLKTLKESRTGYPLLKRTFARLDDLVDRWVTNDAWLVMSIDSLLKMTNRLVTEIAELKRRDPEEAWLIHQSAFSDGGRFLALLADRQAALRDLRGRLAD